MTATDKGEAMTTEMIEAGELRVGDVVDGLPRDDNDPLTVGTTKIDAVDHRTVGRVWVSYQQDDGRIGSGWLLAGQELDRFLPTCPLCAREVPLTILQQERRFSAIDPRGELMFAQLICAECAAVAQAMDEHEGHVR